MPNLICRYCDKPIENGKEVKTLSYWTHLPFVCHAECRQNGERQEAIDCQVIDSDCNDCKHFKRGNLLPRVISDLKRTDGTWTTVEHQPNVFDGICLKFNQPTTAQPNKWTGMNCFEHRRL